MRHAVASARGQLTRLFGDKHGLVDCAFFLSPTTILRPLQSRRPHGQFPLPLASLLFWFCGSTVLPALQVAGKLEIQVSQVSCQGLGRPCQGHHEDLFKTAKTVKAVKALGKTSSRPSRMKTSSRPSRPSKPSRPCQDSAHCPTASRL